MSELDPSTGKAEPSVFSMKFGQFVSGERKAPKGEGGRQGVPPTIL